MTTILDIINLIKVGLSDWGASMVQDYGSNIFQNVLSSGEAVYVRVRGTGQVFRISVEEVPNVPLSQEVPDTSKAA